MKLVFITLAVMWSFILAYCDMGPRYEGENDANLDSVRIEMCENQNKLDSLLAELEQQKPYYDSISYYQRLAYPFMENQNKYLRFYLKTHELKYLKSSTKMSDSISFYLNKVGKLCEVLIKK